MSGADQIGFDFDLASEERIVLDLIRTGRDNARRVDDIAAAANFARRHIEEIVKHLIEDHCYCIGTGTKEPFGYYMITDPAEIENVYASLRRRGISTLYRAARLKKISVQAVFGQGELEAVKR
jgi:predicted transcriptional regulator